MGKLIWGWGVVYVIGVAIYGIHFVRKYILNKKKETV